jgi:hypothetical protein
MRGDANVGAAQGLKVAFSRISQGHESIPMLKEGCVGSRWKESFSVGGVFHQLVVFPGPLMACSELFPVIDGDELIVSLKGKGA